MTPWYGYAVCHSLPKFDTVPIHVVPLLEVPWVNPYPCSTLGPITSMWSTTALNFYLDQIYCARGTVPMLHIIYGLVWA